MSDAYDVVIVGGGVIGSAIAYFLAVEPGFDGSVAVIERDPRYEKCATTRSWGGIRQQFSTPENIRMSAFGAHFVKTAPESLAVDGNVPDLAFRERGYLFLASVAAWPVLEANCRLQSELGAMTQLLDAAQLSKRFPWLNTEGLAGAGFGPQNEGWLDPYALLHGFRRKARASGVVYRQAEVVGFEKADGHVAGVKLNDGENIDCGVVVNAAGPHAGTLAMLAGAALPVYSRKRMTFIFDCRTDLSMAPLTIDVSGVAFRPEGKQYLAIVSPPPGQDPDSDDLELDYTLFEDVIWPHLAQRVPAFEAIKLTGAWAGHYDYNTLDQNAILGFHPFIKGLVFCNGFSGHGVQQAPAAGRAIAELIAYGEFRSLDLSRLGYERILTNQTLKEVNVV